MLLIQLLRLFLSFRTALAKEFTYGTSPVNVGESEEETQQLELLTHS